MSDSSKVIVLSDLHVGMNEEPNYRWKSNMSERLDILIAEIRKKYKTEQTKPTVVITGDVVDHCSQSLKNAMNAKTAGDPLNDLNVTWYRRLSKSLKALTDDGYTLLVVDGNHDFSQKEAANAILKVLDVNTNDPAVGALTIAWFLLLLGIGANDGISAILNSKGREEIERFFYTMAEDYHGDKLSGLSLAPWGYRLFKEWKRSEAEKSDNFIGQNFFKQPTQMDLNWDERKIKKILRVLDDSDTPPRPEDLQKAYEKIERVLFTNIKRGHEIYMVSTTDRHAKKPMPPMHLIDEEDDIWTVCTVEADKRFFMHDGSPRFARGYIGMPERQRMESFIKKSDREHTANVKRLRKSLDLYIDRSSFSNEIKEKLKKISVKFPRPVRIVCLHHPPYNYQSEVKWKTVTEGNEVYERPVIKKKPKPVEGIQLSSRQAALRYLLLIVKKGLSIDREKTLMLLTASKLRWVQLDAWSVYLQNLFGAAGADTTEKLIAAYGAEFGNIIFRRNIESPVPYYRSSCIETENSNHVCVTFPVKFDVGNLMNQFSGLDSACLLSGTDNQFHEGVLRQIGLFDVVVSGHRHSDNPFSIMDLESEIKKVANSKRGGNRQTNLQMLNSDIAHIKNMKSEVALDQIKSCFNFITSQGVKRKVISGLEALYNDESLTRPMSVESLQSQIPRIAIDSPASTNHRAREFPIRFKHSGSSSGWKYNLPTQCWVELSISNDGGNVECKKISVTPPTTDWISVPVVP